MIKKIIIWIIAVVTLVAAITWGYYIFRQQESYKSLVHKKSKALLTISLDDILLNQFFGNWQSAATEGKDFASKLSILKENGIDIRANIFLFALEDNPKSFYALFQLKDEQQFLKFLNEGIVVDSIENDILPGISYAYHQTNKIAFVWRGKELLVGLGFDIDKNKKEMTQLIQSQDDWISIEQFIQHPSILTRKSLRYSDISTDNFIEFDLKGDHLDVSGEFYSEHWNFPKEYLVRELTASGYVAKGWINITNDTIKSKLREVLREFPLSADSLMAHLDGNYIDLEVLKNTVIQTDTIVNYAVDENFETIEERTPYYSKVPNLRIAMHGDSELYQFFPSKLFYQWYQKGDHDFWILSTSKDINQFHLKYTKTKELTNVSVHLADWPTEVKITPILLLKAIASDINFNVKVAESNRLLIEGAMRDYSYKN